MTEHLGITSRDGAMFECVDRGFESLPNSIGNTDGVLFHHVEAACGHGHLPTTRTKNSTV